MPRKKYEYLGGRTVTVTYLATMSNEETVDFLAEQIAHIYHKKYENNKEGHK